MKILPMLKTSVFSLIVVLPLASTALADLSGPHSVLWEKTYDGAEINATDVALATVMDASGNVIVTGFSQDVYYTAKYAAATGALLWEKAYNGPGSLHNRATALAVDASGNVIVTGTSSNPSGNGGDYYTAKYAASTGAVLWEVRYNGTGEVDDTPAGIVVDSNGSVIVTGKSGSSTGSEEYYTVKYARTDGAILWEMHYNGPSNNNDYATAIALDGKNNVVVTGASTNALGNTDIYTAKYAAATGALLWERSVDGTGPFFIANDEGAAIAVDASGNVIVTGKSGGFSSNDIYYTAKYAAATGALLWEKSYGNNGSGDFARDIAVAANGDVIVTGTSFNSDLNEDYYTAKYAAATGNLLWEKRYNAAANAYDGPTALALDASGNVIVTGVSVNAAGNSDYYTAKYAAVNGALLWEKRNDGPKNGNDFAAAIVVDASGNVVVTGAASDGPVSGDYRTIKYAAANGAILWQKFYSGKDSGNEAITAIVVNANGNPIVTGGSENADRNSDFYTAKYSTAGLLLWERRYNGTGNRHDQATAIAVDVSGNVVVTGFSENANQDGDYFTAKYSATTGAVLWKKRYNGTGNAYDQVKDIAVDASGNVIVTGLSENAAGNRDYYTAKYAAATGALLWGKRYNGKGNSSDEAVDVAVDASGNVIVTGYSGNAIGDNVYYTVKYAAATGAILWQRASNGTEGDFATALTVDAKGDVIVTGYSNNSAGNFDYCTIKYAAATGAVLWVKRYNGLAGDDFASDIAVDASNNVVVTGFSENAAGNGDYYTAKYAAATGAVLWGKRYNATGNGKDIPSGIAVDVSGNVVVTGSSENDKGDFDVFTEAYATANGSVLWNNRYNGSGNSFDIAGALALDKSFNVFVVGGASSSNGSMDYFTRKIVPTTKIIGLSGNLAFGNLPVGSKKTSVLTIKNTGIAPLKVTSITYPAGGFSGAYTGTIPAGGSRNVTVTFKPSAVGTFNGNLTVNSDKTGGTNTRPVSGIGKP